MIDPGKLYDWLENRDVDLTQWEGGDDNRRGEKVSRQDWEALFRQYVAEVTDR